MSWVATAVVGAVVATSVYSADQQRKAIHGQQDAMRAQQEEDARKAAEAETAAQVASNAKLADSKRRRRSSALELGDPTASADTLGGAAGVTALASGGTTPAARVASYYPGTSAAYAAGTALGAGSASSRSTGRVGIPKTPDRAMAV
jgi:hypothetical protein